jgi:hypothetical protein
VILLYTRQASGCGWRAWDFRRWSGASLPTVRLLAISPLCARHQEPLTGIEREQRLVTIGSRDSGQALVIAVAPSVHRAKLAGQSHTPPVWFRLDHQRRFRRAVAAGAPSRDVDGWSEADGTSVTANKYLHRRARLGVRKAMEASQGCSLSQSGRQRSLFGGADYRRVGDRVAKRTDFHALHLGSQQLSPLL